jgi:caffeoyl-CoA O-methyltransferase
MQISADVGRLLTLLCATSDARDIVEIGTFTGYSTLCLADGLRANRGAITTFDISGEYSETAQQAWELAGKGQLIEQQIADALTILVQMPQTPMFDLAFVDGNKLEYWAYFTALVCRMRPGGLLIFDNTLWWGRVARPECADHVTLSIRDFNQRISVDPRVDVVVLAISDGVTIGRVRQT